MSILIETLQIPVSFTVTRNKGKENETTHFVNTTLDFSNYTVDDFMNRAIDSVVIAIQSTLRNPPKTADKELLFSTLEGKIFEAPKPGKMVSKKEPEDAMFTYYKKCSLAQRAKLPKAIQEVFEAMIDAEQARKDQNEAMLKELLEAGEAN